MIVVNEEVKRIISDCEESIRTITGSKNLALKLVYHTIPSSTVEGFAQIVSQETEISILLMQSKTRKRPVVLARQLVCYCACLSGIPLNPIGDYLGKRDHTTVIHGRETIKDLISIGDPVTSYFMERIEKRLAS
jgi:chromosomal replication initiator protein